MKFLCDQCKAKYQIADEKVVGRTVRMKCRKCGHLIEVRAAVTETSVSTNAGNINADSDAPPPPGPARKTPLPPKPPPPRATAPSKPGAAKPPPPKPDRPASALAGAFKSNVQREEEGSAPFDMSELSPGDGWYVAINGVPVGPIRMSEVRRKAALGAVTEDSLVWQEGLDEWRPARSLPELAAIVREAASSTRTSIAPPSPTGRLSSPPPPPRGSATSTRPSAGGIPPRSPRPSSGGLPAAARSNVVPIMSRLATAERLEEAPAQGRISSPPHGSEIHPVVVADPFAPSASAAISPPGAAAIVASGAVSGVAAAEEAPKKPFPWIPLALVASATAFGVTAALVNRPPAPAPVQATPASAPTAVAPAAAAVAAATATALAEPLAAAPQAGGKALLPAAGGPKPATTATAAPSATTGSGRSLDLHSLTQNSNVAPSAEDPGGEGPKAPGQCFSQGQVQSVIGMHQLAIRRSCWERDPTTKPTVNVSVSMTIAPDGSAQNVAVSGDEGSVAKCIENDVRGWHFPAMGCSQKTGFSFKFVRQ